MARNFISSIVAFFAALLVAGCGKPPQQILKIGVYSWAGYQPLVIADELRHYGQTEVRIVEYPSATDALAAYRNRVIDIAATTLDEAIVIAEDIPDTRVFYTLDSSAGADALIAKEPIVTLADLKGRRIGYESTALGAYFLSRALDSVAMKPGEITPVSVRADEHEAQFERGEFDALVTYEPMLSRLRARGAKVVFNSQQVPGEIVDVLIARSSLLDQRTSDVHRVVAAWLRVCDYLEKEPEDGQRRLASCLRCKPEVVADVWRSLKIHKGAENTRYFAQKGAVLQDLIHSLGGVMRANHLIKQKPNAALIVDTRFGEKEAAR